MRRFVEKIRPRLESAMPPWRRPVLQSGAAAAALGVRDAALHATTVRAVGLRNEPWQGLTVTYVFHIHHYASLEVLTSTNTYARIQGRAVKTKSVPAATCICRSPDPSPSF